MNKPYENEDIVYKRADHFPSYQDRIEIFAKTDCFFG